MTLGLGLMMATASAATTISRIDPTDWYVGMKDPSLQLMVYGKDVKNVKQVTTDYAGVKVDSIVRLDSPNYLLVYLNLQGAKAGQMTLNFDGKKVRYTLKDRTMRGEDHKGFSNADVLYLLMPDRFANGNPKNDVVKGMRDQACDRTKPSLRHGGDLAGIEQHLDYFTDLGVTALWFTPILENNWPNDNGVNSSYHGYATTDYYKVDPRFGTNAEYKDWFNNPNYGLQTSYKLTPVLDPYASKQDMKETVDGWFVKSMPDLNQRNPHLMRYLIQNSEWWIETAGIDGIRMDTYPYADRKAMAEWMKVLDTEYPNFNTVGETWVTEPAYTAAWQKDSKLSTMNSYLKTVMDFSFFDKLNQAKHEETDDWWKGLNRIYNSLCYDYLYNDPSHVLAFIENHDTDRFLGNTKDSTMLKQALALLLTINRIPQLYYGTEVLMNGTKEVTDGNVRKDFPGGFAGDTHNCFTAEGRTKAENAMFQWESKLLHWRQGNEVISKGKQTQFIPWKGVYVIARQYEGRTVLTILNGKRSAATLPVARYAEVIGKATTATDVISGRKIDLTHDITLQPREALVVEF